jgi:hypothetical protein
MPTNSIGGSAQGMVLDVQVTGTQITATARLQATCSATSSFGITYGDILTGSIAADGTFSISSPGQSPIATLSVKGSVPSAAGATWPGTYTVTFNGTGCSAVLNGAFTATPFAQVSGTYSGSGSVLGGSSSLPIVASVSLQQGSPLYSNGTPTSSAFGLAGSIQLQGLSCFSKGTTSTTLPSTLEGNEVFAEFTMDDGSRLELVGDITDTSANTLSLHTFLVASGNCAGTYIAPYPPILLRH